MGPNFDIFWFGLGLAYIMVFEFTLVCAEVRSIILNRELAAPADRIGSLQIGLHMRFPMHNHNEVAVLEPISMTLQYAQSRHHFVHFNLVTIFLIS